MSKILILNGKEYKFVKSKTKDYGYHIESIDGKPGTIAVNKNLSGEIELDTLIHEMLHACADFGKEEWVNSTATEIAAALWQLGYRKHAEKERNKQ